MPGSIYFEEGENLFPIISLITERVFEVHTLGFKLCCSWGPWARERVGDGGEVTKEKGWCVHSSNLLVAISFLKGLTFQPSACLHWGELLTFRICKPNAMAREAMFF